jgi:hypothetical protein
MVVKEHSDQDSVESAYGWHICIVEQETQAHVLLFTVEFSYFAQDKFTQTC